jgi:hypothetical protein
MCSCGSSVNSALGATAPGLFQTSPLIQAIAPSNVSYYPQATNFTQVTAPFQSTSIVQGTGPYHGINFTQVAGPIQRANCVGSVAGQVTNPVQATGPYTDASLIQATASNQPFVYYPQTFAPTQTTSFAQAVAPIQATSLTQGVPVSVSNCPQATAILPNTQVTYPGTVSTATQQISPVTLAAFPQLTTNNYRHSRNEVLRNPNEPGLFANFFVSSTSPYVNTCCNP